MPILLVFFSSRPPPLSTPSAASIPSRLCSPPWAPIFWSVPLSGLVSLISPSSHSRFCWLFPSYLSAPLRFGFPPPLPHATHPLSFFFLLRWAYRVAAFSRFTFGFRPPLPLRALLPSSSSLVFCGLPPLHLLFWGILFSLYPFPFFGPFLIHGLPPPPGGG